MICYTQMSKEAWNILQTTGTLTCDHEHYCSTNSEFIKAFDWLMEEGKKRGLHHYRDEYPIWVWVMPKDNVLDIKLESGQVLVKLYIPQEKLLVTSFDQWHCVICDAYIALSENDFDQNCDDEEKKIASWRYCIDYEEYYNKVDEDFDCRDDNELLQAITYRINIGQVLGYLFV